MRQLVSAHGGGPASLARAAVAASPVVCRSSTLLALAPADPPLLFAAVFVPVLVLARLAEVPAAAATAVAALLAVNVAAIGGNGSDTPALYAMAALALIFAASQAAESIQMPSSADSASDRVDDSSPTGLEDDLSEFDRRLEQRLKERRPTRER